MHSVWILPNSFYHLQKYRLFIGSVALSTQKYYKANLIYSYGRVEDIPMGGLFRITAGKEVNEFKKRTYLGFDVSLGVSNTFLGYTYGSAGIAAFINNNLTEQGVLALSMNYFSKLLYLGNHKIRNFVNIDYTRGFDRYSDEYLGFKRVKGFSDFRNDSIYGTQRISISLESVLFSPIYFYGFRFAFFSFADLAFLADSNEMIGKGDILSDLGIGIRIRNDNLALNTFQLRLSFFPNLPDYSRIKNLAISGEQLLRPRNFDPGPPSVLVYR